MKHIQKVIVKLGKYVSFDKAVLCTSLSILHDIPLVGNMYNLWGIRNDVTAKSDLLSESYRTKMNTLSH